MARRELTGLVVALAGGARGIGLETAKQLAAAGAKVGVGDIQLELLERSLGQIGGETAAFELDVTDRASYRAFLDGVEQRFGAIDVLINNAGVMALGPFLDEEDSTAERMTKINFYGPLLALKLALPRMIARGSGQVVIVDSASARMGVPGASTYSATKHAVYGLADAVDLELRNEPVDITVILPTVVNTDLTRGVTGKTRGVATLEPQDVATAIVGAITRPRFAVYVPASLGLTFAISAAIPRRWRNVIGRLTKSDRVLTEVDTQTREQYEREAFAEKDRVS